ncbi:hypothetical protein SERLA73DRAFT_149015 [Serpula lacrymans var. lacrymans S7.3]|uniref:Uncharacterized protein n=1 Tax=Serpula lacrymans var. lacrymans (strain S7.3) TaxID=936435 RepID=F8PHS2_SERL3|nr:hypothetical protein SERLA73DRAFT_149015 [Serpula lacrymans var. lacrymans S7.3]
MSENERRNSPVGAVPHTILKPRASELYTGKDRLRRAMGWTDNKKKHLCIQTGKMLPPLFELIKQYLSNHWKSKSREERKRVASTSPPDIDHLEREGEQEQEQEQPQDGANTRNIDENRE